MRQHKSPTLLVRSNAPKKNDLRGTPMQDELITGGNIVSQGKREAPSNRTMTNDLHGELAEANAPARRN